MERTSSKHGPELDEQMKKETADITHGSPTPSRAQEHRQLEPIEDEESAPSTIMPPALESESRGLTHEEINKRTTLASFLDQCIFPAETDGLVESAKENNAGEWVLGELGRLPEGTKFENVQAVWEALGGHEERRF